MAPTSFRKIVLTAVLCAASIFAAAQTDTAKIQGTITDVQGGVIPNATITATNTATGQAYTATTDGNGVFTIPALVRGSYKADVTANGFKTDTEQFQLNISEQKNLSVVLQPGAATETVEVSADNVLVDTTSSSTGEVIQGRQVVELPLNGRNFTQLALLTPGVTRGAYGDQASGVNNNVETFRNGTTGGASLSVNGLRPQANNFILDGVDNNESLVNTINFFPPVEATQEFRVTTSVAPAEFGRAGGGIIQTSIKSGTNQIHGSAFEFLRNSAFDASPNFFNPVTNGKKTKVQPFKRNQFGGTLGGPIWKNKLFLFGDYQGLRQDQPLNPEFATVPTPLMRMGNFSELLGTNLTHFPTQNVNNVPVQQAPPGCPGAAPLTGGQIFNPVTCAPFPGNIIPAGQLNKAAVNYLNAFPLPNVAGTIEQNFVNSRRNIQNFNDFDVRLDFNATSRDTIFGRYSYGQDVFNLTPRLIILPSGFGSGLNVNHPRGVAVGEAHIFSNSVVNDFHYGYSRPFFSFLNPFNNIPLSKNLGIVNANRLPQLGGGALIGGFNSEIEFTGDGGPFITPENSQQFEDSLSYVRGNHSFRFGANIIRRDVNFFISDFRGKGFFNIGPGTGDFTGYEVSELLSGFIDNYLISTPVNAKTRSYETGYYGQDDWKVSRKLTLNLGLRYDLYTYPYEQKNQWSNFNLNTGTLIEAGKNGASRSLIKTDRNNFAPRFGFAYDLFGSGMTVLRGGYGIFYFLDRGGIGNQLSANPDISGSGSFQVSNGFRTTFSGQIPGCSPVPGPGCNNNQNATAPLPLPTASSVDPAAPKNATVIAQLPNNQNSSIQEYNLQVSQAFGANTAFNIAYVGTKVDHLTTYFNYNNPTLGGNPSAFAGTGLNIIVGANTGTSHYNSLQTSLNRRFDNGLQYTVAYTFSHTLDNSNGAFSNTGGGSRIFVDPLRGGLLRFNYGNSDTDQRHAFNFAALYELPFGRGKRFGGNWNGFTNSLLGGWQLNPFVQLGSGTPFDLNANGTRVNYNGGPVSIGSEQRAANGNIIWLSAPTGTFTGTPSGAIPTLARNTFHGPGYQQIDASLFKDFAITERFRLQFRAEGFNLLNTAQFQNPDSNVNDSNFGQINATRQASERQLQFAVRFTF